MYKFCFLHVRVLKRAHTNAQLLHVLAYVCEFDPPFKFSTRQASDRDPLQEDHLDGKELLITIEVNPTNRIV